MEKELSYSRYDIKRRHAKRLKSVESWLEDIKELINLLLTEGYEEKAKEWAILYHSLEITKDVWEKLVAEL